MKKRILIALVVVGLLAVAGPGALAWQEGGGTNWYYIDANYEGYHDMDGPLVIKLDGDSSAGQTFYVGDTVDITVELHAVAQSCGGDGNGAYTEWLLEVNGPSGSGSTGDWNYDHSSGCAVADEDTTLTITYNLTDLGTHTVYMSSYAAVAQYWTDVADESADALLTFEVLLPCESVAEEVDNTCPPDDEWRNHGQYVRCAANIVDGYLEAGWIDEETASCVMNPIARSDVGKPSRGH